MSRELPLKTDGADLGPLPKGVDEKTFSMECTLRSNGWWKVTWSDWVIDLDPAGREFIASVVRDMAAALEENEMPQSKGAAN